DVETIGAHLASDVALAPLIARRPGLRTPGAWDGFETAVRAVLGQQVTISAARKLAGKLVASCGPVVSANVSGDPRLTRAFQRPVCAGAAARRAWAWPGGGRAGLVTLARGAAADPKLLEPIGSYEEVVARLCALPGFGPWTAQYWALRALRDSDAFPA